MSTHPIPSPLAAAPFAILLGAVAALPLIPAAAHWWEHNRSKLLASLGLGAVVLGHYAFRGWGFHEAAPGPATVVAVLEHAILRDYLPFVVLLFSLYVIAGGLWVEGDIRARPIVNVGFLGFGALLASFIGTTGASMILIRPLLQTNGGRTRVTHTLVFFIFLVSNVGGCLLPIGDPPLFLGYLQGVPFLWPLRLVWPWLFTVAVLLAIYYAWDRFAFRREPPEAIAAEEASYMPPRLGGKRNLAWLAGVVLTVALVVPGRPFAGTAWVVPDLVREAILLALTGLSVVTTPRGLRILSGFDLGPILEVACLFLGVFLTMQPALEILQARGSGLGLGSPASFFWATGGLSGVLDNAPTYVVFLEVAKTLPARAGAGVVRLIDGSAVDEGRLAAISLGAVFAGALTYIGNGPNLMVKSIAESRGRAMPSFFGYLGYSLVVLLPVFAAATLLFVG
jgi:Na+/H+ antiporter NhaD/arsenite permease-like protein